MESLGEGGMFVLLVIHNLPNFRDSNLPVHFLRFISIPQYPPLRVPILKGTEDTLFLNRSTAFKYQLET